MDASKLHILLENNFWEYPMFEVSECKQMLMLVLDIICISYNIVGVLKLFPKQMRHLYYYFQIICSMFSYDVLLLCHLELCCQACALSIAQYCFFNQCKISIHFLNLFKRNIFSKDYEFIVNHSTLIPPLFSLRKVIALSM